MLTATKKLIENYLKRKRVHEALIYNVHVLVKLNQKMATTGAVCIILKKVMSTCSNFKEGTEILSN